MDQADYFFGSDVHTPFTPSPPYFMQYVPIIKTKKAPGAKSFNHE